jgi:arylsulfatase A-like enzyme
MALRMGDWKLLLSPSDKDAELAARDTSAPGKMELYNLADDLSEKTNLAASQPEKVQAMRARLDALMKNHAAPGGGIEGGNKKRN